MRTNHFFERLLFLVLSGCAWWACGLPGTCEAAVANVSIVDFAFSPSRTTINPGDQVTWNWVGSIAHSSTSDTGVWDSGIQGHGSVFSQTFNTAGSFPYHCEVHPFMKATITVGGGSTNATTAVLVVQINGTGTVSPNLNGQNLTIGKSYTMTAKPGVGFLFSSWSGSASSGTPVLTFVMQSNMVLQANFVANPFAQAAGTFNGLFLDPNAVTARSSGSITLVTTATGKLTGKLQMGNPRSPFKGQFDANGSATSTIVRPNQNPVTVVLQLDMAGLERITGTVSDGTFTVPLAADRAVFNARQNPAPQAGLYTMIIFGSPGSASLPGGASVATIAVDPSGKIRLSGALGDSTKITQASTVSRNGNWPFYAPLYGGAGSIIGWLSFQSTAENDVNGDVVWLKPNVPTAKFYPAGFSFETTAAGFHYHPPAPGSNVLTLTSGDVVFTGGGMASAITNRISLGANNHVTNLSSNLLSLTFKSSNGLFSGRVAKPNNSMPITAASYGGGMGGGPMTQSLSFSGVVLQGLGTGSGYFLSTNQSGQVVVGP